MAISGQLDGYRRRRVLREGFQNDGRFGGPPAINGLLADAGLGREPFHGQFGVANLLRQLQRGFQDRFLGCQTARAPQAA